MRILVANDDGVLAAGLLALAEALRELGEVWVVAPEQEQSAASRALSLHRPLRIKQVRERWYAVDGTPCDCSHVAINHLLRGEKPALMVSGVNHGANLADDVTYSGTVAAAIEASTLGVPALAVSLVKGGPQSDFSHAARFAVALGRAVLQRKDLEPGFLLNVNVPHAEPRGYAITTLGKHLYSNEVIEKVDPRGRKYYWIGGSEYQYEAIPGSDCSATLRDRLISVTPIKLNLTRAESIPELRQSVVAGFEQVGGHEEG